MPQVGELTFLEAYDVSGRILNICVSREDGKVESLMCNYLTTPQMLVWSACVASCAIPGVYEPVELMAKNRNGETVPYFRGGTHRWTDGGLQEDLPQRRLSELFNVNQFIVSQVNPLASLFVPVRTALPWLTESINLLRHQLVGLLRGVSGIAQGRLVRPAGVRIVDVLMQEYEGSLTIFPNWHLSDLGGFIANFDAQRMENYELDGARAVWPKLPAIRSLCEIEFELDRISTQLTEQLAVERVAAAMAMGGGSVSGSGSGSACGLALTAQRPSYSSGLAGLDASADIDSAAADDKTVAGTTSVRQTESLLMREAAAGDDEAAAAGIIAKASSYASLLSLGAV